MPYQNIEDVVTKFGRLLGLTNRTPLSVWHTTLRQLLAMKAKEAQKAATPEAKAKIEQELADFQEAAELVATLHNAHQARQQDILKALKQAVQIKDRAKFEKAFNDAENQPFLPKDKEPAYNDLLAVQKSAKEVWPDIVLAGGVVKEAPAAAPASAPRPAAPPAPPPAPPDPPRPPPIDEVVAKYGKMLGLTNRTPLSVWHTTLQQLLSLKTKETAKAATPEAKAKLEKELAEFKASADLVAGLHNAHQSKQQEILKQLRQTFQVNDRPRFEKVLNDKEHQPFLPQDKEPTFSDFLSLQASAKEKWPDLELALASAAPAAAGAPPGAKTPPAKPMPAPSAPPAKAPPGPPTPAVKAPAAPPVPPGKVQTGPVSKGSFPPAAAPSPKAPSTPSAPPAPAAPEPKKGKGALIAGVVAAVVVIGGGIAFFMHSSSPPKQAVAPPPAPAAPVVHAAPAKGWLEITSTPDEAQVTVDGLPRGNTPIAKIELDPGQPHVIIAIKPGYLAMTQTVAVTSGAGQTLPFILQVEPSVLKVDSAPPGAVVSLNGSDMNAVTPCALQVKAGDYKVGVRLKGYLAVEKAASVAAGATESVSFTLEERKIHIGVLSRPRAKIIVDGNATAKFTDSWIEAPIGDGVNVEVRADGYVPAHRTLQLAETDNNRRVVNFGDLEPSGLPDDASRAYTDLKTAAILIETEPDATKRADLYRKYLDDSEPLVRSGVSLIDVWTVRAMAALVLNQPHAGWEAGQRILAIGADNANDTNTTAVVARLKRLGWLETQAPDQSQPTPAPTPAPTPSTAPTPAPAQPAPPPIPAPVDVHHAAMPKPKAGQDFQNSLDMKFKPVPGTPVLFCVWQTRVRDYKVYVAAHPRVDDHWKNVTWRGLAVNPSDDCPVVEVSWDDAKAFCDWLTKKEREEGTLGANDYYRLPMDLEWSVAAGLGNEDGDSPELRATTGRFSKNARYPWGMKWPPPLGAGNLADVSLRDALPDAPIIDGYRDGFAGTSPVGSFPANALGFFDLGTNVREWCEDRYSLVAGNEEKRVLRGVSWLYYDNNPKELLASNRDELSRANRSETAGFRIVVVVGGR